MEMVWRLRTVLPPEAQPPAKLRPGPCRQPERWSWAQPVPRPPRDHDRPHHRQDRADPV